VLWWSLDESSKLTTWNITKNLITKVQKPTTMYVINQRFMGPNTITIFFKNIAKSLEMEKKSAIDKKKKLQVTNKSIRRGFPT
jgi:hypothetical protein